MIHSVHVIARQESTSRCWWGGSGCFAQILKNFNHFSFIDIVEPGRHPYIGGITITFCIVSTCRRGSFFSVLDAKVSCMFCLWDVVVLMRELSCVRVALSRVVCSLRSRLRCYQAELLYCIRACRAVSCLFLLCDSYTARCVLCEISHV